MLTDIEIDALIKSPKKIIGKIPASGYKQEERRKSCDLTLESVDTEGEVFSVFIRQNSHFIENYSIGLRYKTKNIALKSITLIRYNGPHGEKSQHQDGHYNKPHIHRITANELVSGSNQPQESNRKTTEIYNTFEQAILVFFRDIGATNYLEYFLENIQQDMFNEHQ